MPTTALFVEVLVVGAMTLAWLVTLFAAFLPLPNSAQIAALASLIREASPLLVLPSFALTYAVGWITNFCSERFLKIFFQHRIRDNRFGDPKRYEMARLMMFQHGSDELVHDVLVDRHIIRLARGGVMNFTLLAVALSIHGLHGRTLAWPFAFLCLVFAALSFCTVADQISFALCPHRTHWGFFVEGTVKSRSSSGGLLSGRSNGPSLALKEIE